MQVFLSDFRTALLLLCTYPGARFWMKVAVDRGRHTCWSGSKSALLSPQAQLCQRPTPSPSSNCQGGPHPHSASQNKQTLLCLTPGASQCMLQLKLLVFTCCLWLQAPSPEGPSPVLSASRPSVPLQCLSWAQAHCPWSGPFLTLQSSV